MRKRHKSGYRGFLTAGTVPSPYNKASSKGYHRFLMNDYEGGERVVTLSYLSPMSHPQPHDSLGFPTPVLTIPCPLPSSRLSPLL